MSVFDVFFRKCRNECASNSKSNTFDESSLLQGKSITQLRLGAEQLLDRARAAADVVNHTSNPQMFFSTYEDIIQVMRQLVPMESIISFEGRSPSTILAELESQEQREAAIAAMVNRCIETCRWNSRQEAEGELSLYLDQIPQFVRELISNLSSDLRSPLQFSIEKYTIEKPDCITFKQENDTLKQKVKPATTSAEIRNSEELRQKEREREEQHRLQTLREENVRSRLAESVRQEAELKQQREAHRLERQEKIQGMGYSALLEDAILFSSEQMYITKEEMQEEYPGVPPETKRRLLEDLYKLNAIQPRPNGESWLSILDHQRAQDLIAEIENTKVQKGVSPQAFFRDIDTMEGHEFEHYCAELLQRNGFTEVEVTKASGDFGVDVLAKKDGVSYAIQCKCYKDTVGNHAVQEALSGAQYYHCMVAAVMTNNYFTPAAIETAEKTNVLLWDRDAISKMAE